MNCTDRLNIETLTFLIKFKLKNFKNLNKILYIKISLYII